MQPEQTRRERFTTTAETLSKRFQTGILASMQEKPLWVVWKPEKDRQGIIHKRPYTPRNYPASMYKPRQWASVDVVLEALATGNFAGIGIMLPAPYVLIDKDVTADAPIYDPVKRKIVSALALRLLQHVPSYAELSPNNGLHIALYPTPTPTGAIGEVSSVDWAGMKQERIGDGQAWYYRQDRTIILWELTVFAHYEQDRPLAPGGNLSHMWRGFEGFLVNRFPQARRVATLWS